MDRAKRYHTDDKSQSHTEQGLFLNLAQQLCNGVVALSGREG
jgi:hypothetical protein